MVDFYQTFDDDAKDKTNWKKVKIVCFIMFMSVLTKVTPFILILLSFKQITWQPLCQLPYINIFFYIKLTEYYQQFNFHHDVKANEWSTFVIKLSKQIKNKKLTF